AMRVAGLVEDRREGRWIEYRLARDSRNPHAPAVLALLRAQLVRDPQVRADRRRLRRIQAIPMERLCSLPPSRVPVPRRPAGGSPR
ncbi:MAG TPA: hypothetical protein VLV15_16420, partial [Dongiaceae bacterium]|nr:hypothetical protein [Dongiaceae bacterium]